MVKLLFGVADCGYGEGAGKNAGLKQGRVKGQTSGFLLLV
jgi:hypothetical protein